MSKAAELAALIGSQSALSNRNLIINGAMQVAQRGTSSTSNGIQTVDRFGLYNGSLGVFTQSQSTDSPNGFAYSWKLDCTTADASPAASDYLFIRTLLEGQDLQQLSYGNSSAKACTVSFYAKANKTGSFTFSARQLDNSNRMYSKNVSISTANTWERISVELPADASGLINNDNGAGLELQIWLNSGSTYSGGSEQAWGTETNANKYLGTLDLGASISDEFYITGVQLEIGEQATPFEHRSFADELARCQRYYWNMDMTGSNEFQAMTMWGIGPSDGAGWLAFPCEMRDHPSVSLSGTVGDNTQDWTVFRNGYKTITSVGSSAQNLKGCRIDVASSSQFAHSDAFGLYAINADGGAKFEVSAEL